MTPSPPDRDPRLSPGTRRILHLDVEAFPASVECALHPELRGEPLMIGVTGPRNLVRAP